VSDQADEASGLPPASQLFGLHYPSTGLMRDIVEQSSQAIIWA
jgi:hypothetical protein